MRSLRVLMPLGMAIDILEHANMEAFVDMAGAVECRADELKSAEDPVWFLKEVPRQIRVVDVDNCMVRQCNFIA